MRCVFDETRIDLSSRLTVVEVEALVVELRRVAVDIHDLPQVPTEDAVRKAWISKRCVPPVRIRILITVYAVDKERSVAIVNLEAEVRGCIYTAWRVVAT